MLNNAMPSYFTAALERYHGAEGPGVALLAPVCERRGVDVLAPQDGTNPAGIGGKISLGQNAELVLGCKIPSARPLR